MSIERLSKAIDRALTDSVISTKEINQIAKIVGKDTDRDEYVLLMNFHEEVENCAYNPAVAPTLGVLLSRYEDR